MGQLVAVRYADWRTNRSEVPCNTSMDNEHLRKMITDFRDRVGVPAAGAAMVTRTGDLSVQVAGVRRRGGSDPVAVDDQWHIGSCAKAMTAALYARLVERGDTEWGVPISEFFANLVGDLDAGWSNPTIDEVLVCRSGMRGNLSRTEMLAAWDDTSPMTEQRSRAVISAMSVAPSRHGTFVYSNLGYIVVGAAIDRLAGMPFEDALRVHLLEPLGITSAGFGSPPEIWGHESRLRLGVRMIGRGAPAEPGDARSDNPGVMTPAGRMHLTLSDWAKFQQLFLNRGGDILQPATVEHLLAEPQGEGSGMAMGWAKARGLDGVSYGMQGSNTMSMATALIDTDFEHSAMVVVNDGRTSLLQESAKFGASMLMSG